MATTNKIVWETIYKEKIDSLPWLKNKIPYKLLKDFISGMNGERYILDYGCGNGRHSRYLLKYCGKVDCADISSTILKSCQKLLGKRVEQYIVTPNLSIKYFSNCKYDGILVWGVLHHINKRSWPKYFKEFCRILKRNGIILLGGHSSRDKEIIARNCISPYTELKRYPLDSMVLRIILNNELEIIKSGSYKFTEAITHHCRDFDFYLLKKK